MMWVNPAVLARHERVAFSFSGGKDSTAVWHLLRDANLLDKVTTYHMDTGDLLPETREVVAHYEAMTPHFVRVQGDVHYWMMVNGLPTDLLPHSAHFVGQAMGEGHGTRLVPRYDCCYNNLMLPIFRRIQAAGNTLLIRGTKAVDMKRLPCGDGDELEGVEIYYPLQDATNEQVFAYLDVVDAKVSPIYQHVTNSPECATCPAWWGEKRASYLKGRHPDLFRRYKTRMALVAAELRPSLAAFQTEIDALVDAPALPIPEMEMASEMLTRDGIRVLQGHRLGPTDREHVHALMEYLPVIPPGATVLDAGCGVGEVSRILGDVRDDLDFVLLNKAPNQLRQAPDGERFQRVVGDFHHMPLRDASVDLTMFCYAICHADHAVALHEAARVTRPGGSLFIYDYERKRGSNALMEQVLFARAMTHDTLCNMAFEAGWDFEAVDNPPGDDMFRVLFTDAEVHAAIFDDLRPAAWQFTRR